MPCSVRYEARRVWATGGKNFWFQEIPYCPDTPCLISHAAWHELTRKVAEIKALGVSLELCYRCLPGASRVSPLKSVFESKTGLTSRRHPFCVTFIFDVDKPRTHCMHQRFISRSSYSELQMEISTKSYGSRRKTKKSECNW